ALIRYRSPTRVPGGSRRNTSTLVSVSGGRGREDPGLSMDTWSNCRSLHRIHDLPLQVFQQGRRVGRVCHRRAAEERLHLAVQAQAGHDDGDMLGQGLEDLEIELGESRGALPAVDVDHPHDLAVLAQGDA